MNTFDFIENERLRKQLCFLVEADKMKEVFRRTINLNSRRRENDAEHSWSFALYALILQEYASDSIDINKVIKMALVHDLVEVYAGDTFAYDSKGYEDKSRREQESAEKLFGILECDQKDEIKALWEEFEANETPEAKFANCCDRIQPLIHNYLTEGHTWKEGDVSSAQVLDRMNVMKNNAPELWNVVEGVVKACIEQGDLKK